MPFRDGSTMRRFIIEFGSGVDLHGMDSTKAAVKAVKDAVSHCCLCGLSEVLDKDEKVHLGVVIGVPGHEEVDADAVRAALPVPEMCSGIDIREGGLRAKGLHVEALGKGDCLIIANAVITVYVGEQVS